MSPTMNQTLEKIIQEAKNRGASGAAIISVDDIQIDESLADRCHDPRCPNYGLSVNCPPNVSGPSGMIKTLDQFDTAIFFKIDVSADILYSSDNLDAFRILHETSAALENVAIELGFDKAQAYAGGSCKQLFCNEQKVCRALHTNQECRHPEQARPSMSGFGINVAKLFEVAGWTMTWDFDDSGSKTTKMGNVCGLVLIG